MACRSNHNRRNNHNNKHHNDLDVDSRRARIMSSIGGLEVVAIPVGNDESK